jgi:hypothetical protein
VSALSAGTRDVKETPLGRKSVYAGSSVPATKLSQPTSLAPTVSCAPTGPNFWLERARCRLPRSRAGRKIVVILTLVGLGVATFVVLILRNARPTRSIAHVLHDVEHPIRKA